MARILVVGSGFAGLSAAARLAKLRHDVTVLEQRARPGGRLLGLDIGGDRWAAGPQSVTLPGVFRDLFRKSGRPMDALIEISPGPARRHLLPGSAWRRSTEFDLPFGTRGAQHDAVARGFGADRWSDWVDALADPWDTLRRVVLETVGDAPVSPATRAALLGELTLERVARTLPRRLRPLGADVIGFERSDPAVLAVWHYVERNFGRWSFDGGDAGLAAALVRRLGERRVGIETGVEATSVISTAGRATGVALADGTVRAADVVVWAVGESSPGTDLTAVRLGEANLPDEFVVHGPAVVHGWRSDEHRWVLSAAPGIDPVRVLDDAGHDVGAHVLDRHVVTGRPIARGPGWLPRPAVESSPGHWLVGGAAVAGAGLEVTGMGTAALATALGPVPR